MSRGVTLRATGLGVTRGGNVLLDGVDATFGPGRVHVIAGPNGAGKTTLLRALLGLQPPTRGEVTIADTTPDGRHAERAISALSPPARARLLAAHLASPVDALGFSVADVIRLGRHGLPETALEASRAVTEALARFDLTRLAQRPVGLLSAGERQRVSLARTFARETPALLLDEPASHLDVLHVTRLADLLHAAAEAGRTVVAVLHDLPLIARLADVVTLLSAGRVIAEGPPESVLTPAAIRAVWGVEADLVTLPDGDRLVHVRGVAR